MFKYKIRKNIIKSYSTLLKVHSPSANKKQQTVEYKPATITSSILPCYSKLGKEPHYFGVLRNQKLWYPLYDRIYPSNSQARCYSSDNRGNQYQSITDLPIKISPNLFTQLNCLFTTFFIVKPTIDSNFSMGEFLTTTKKVVPVISHMLANGDVDNLENLVTNNVLEQIKTNLPKLSVSQREELAAPADDITISMIYNMSVNDENADEKRLQILTIHHVLKGYGELRKKSADQSPQQIFQSETFQIQNAKFHVLNYRFSRTYTSKDEGGDWIINGLNHQPGSSLGFQQFFF